MKHMVNGRLVELSTERDGSIDSDRLRKAAGIPDDRPLILQMPDGSNRVVNPGERVYLKPGESIIDAPEHKRGDQPISAVAACRASVANVLDSSQRRPSRAA
jgi:hypothetical protein